MTPHTREAVDAHKRATGTTPMPPAMRKAFDREWPDGSAYRITAEESIEWALTWLTRNGHAVERADAPAEPLDTPLPCAVTIGKVTFGKGVKLRSLVNKARRDSDLVQAMDKKEMMQLAASLEASRECDIDESPEDLPEDPPNDVLIRAHARYQARKAADEGSGSVFEFPGLGESRKDADIPFDLMREVGFISDKYSHWREVYPLAVDDPEYDCFAAGFKIALASVEAAIAAERDGS